MPSAIQTIFLGVVSIAQLVEVTDSAVLGAVAGKQCCILKQTSTSDIRSRPDSRKWPSGVSTTSRILSHLYKNRENIYPEVMLTSYENGR